MEYVRWRKVDLHIHSNASHDCTATPKDIVDKVCSSNINLFSVTDHNNVDNVDEIKALVNEKREQGFEVQFLPGIEIRTDRGKDGVAIHLVIIFPESYTKQMIIDKFLSSDGLKLTKTHLIEKGKEKLGASFDDIKYYDEGCKVAFVDFEIGVKLAKELGALAIAVHPKNAAGIEKELDYQNHTSDSFKELLINSVNLIDMMELPKNLDQAKKNRAFYLNENKNFIKIMPSIRCSDAHTTAQIGNNFTYIKMDTINFNGLKQVLFEPKHRICIDACHPEPSYLYIKSIEASGGYYQGHKFTFSPELNCIIGGRGSGKSVIIDLLRFSFNKYDKNDKDYQDYLDRIYNLLKFNNTVEVICCLGAADYTITRTCNIKKDKLKNSDTIYIDYSDEPNYHELDIELYSQGNLKQITKKADEQLKLIDDIGDHHSLLKEIEQFKMMLMDNADAQLAKLALIKDDIITADEKSFLEESIKEKVEILKDETVLEFTNTQEEKKYYDLIINNTNRLIEIRKSYLENASDLLSVDFPENQSSMLRSLEESYRDFTKRLKYLDKKVSRYIRLACHFLKNIKSDGAPWIETYKAKETEFIKYLKENDLENIADETNKLQELNDKLLNIEVNILPKLEKKIEEIRELQQERQEILLNFQLSIEKLKTKRAEACEKISLSHENLNITISNKQNKANFQTHIEEIMSGQNIKQKDALSNLLHKVKTPIELATIIKQQDTKKLANEFKLTQDAAGKIVARYSSEVLVNEFNLDIISKEFFELQLIHFDDVVEIEVKDKNDAIFKKFRRFSPGQQCAYLLSILLDANSNPLIIDQPEDELDWNYIQDFIEQVRRCKNQLDGKGRQFVFVTHNQNITVLSDSEKIIKVINMPGQEDGTTSTGNIEAQGGLERSAVRDAVLSLEGGTEAFEKRKKRYGI